LPPAQAEASCGLTWNAGSPTGTLCRRKAAAAGAYGHHVRTRRKPVRGRRVSPSSAALQRCNGCIHRHIRGGGRRRPLLCRCPVIRPRRKPVCVQQGKRCILRYNGQTGAFIDAFVPSQSGGLERPYDFTFGPDGNLYVTHSPSEGAIYRYNGTTGAFMDAFVPIRTAAWSRRTPWPSGRTGICMWWITPEPSASTGRPAL